MCRYRKIFIILIISLFSIFYNVMPPAVHSAPTYPRNQMKRTNHNYPYPVVYERLIRRRPSIYPNDLYMEEFMEIFHLDHPIKKHTITDDEVDLIIRCDFDPSLKECELLKKPEEGFTPKPKPPKRIPPFPPSVLKPETTTPSPTRTTTAYNWPWSNERTTTPKTTTTTDANWLWSAEKTTGETPAKTSTTTETNWPWSDEETTTTTEKTTTSTDYMPLLPDISQSNEEEEADPDKPRPEEEYDDNEVETHTENVNEKNNNNNNNNDDDDNNVDADDVDGNGDAYGDTNYDNDENEADTEDAENYDENGEKNYNLVFN